MNKAVGGWEGLRCPFFAPVCRNVLGSYLEEQGFAEAEETSVGGVVYRRSPVFLELTYEPESSPAYSPAVVLGIGSGRYGEDGLPSAVPLWFLIPDDSTSRRFTLWTFRTEPELESALLRIRDEVLERYGKPLWLNRDLLTIRIKQFRDAS